jgi:hypothetical protein
VLYIDVAKVDWDVAHVLMAIHMCFKCMLQMLHLFQTYVASVSYTCMLQAYVSSVLGVSYICCKCFIWMLQMFAMVFKCFHVFSQVFQMFVSSVSSIFFCIL